MRRSLWAIAMSGGVAVTFAQEPPDTAPALDETPPPAAVDPGTDAVEPAPDAPDDAALPVDPPVADDAPLPERTPPARSPRGTPRRSGPLPGNALPEQGRPGATLPVDPDAALDRDADAQPDLEIELEGARQRRGRLEVDQFPDSDLPSDDLPPQRRPIPSGADLRDTDGQGAPLLEERLVPEDDPLREPIERQPTPLPGRTRPLPPDPDGPGPIPGRRPGVLVDPAYGAPAPPRVQPEITIDEVVRNPIRVYEARLLVLMGAPACSDALDTLVRRFPTDARVQYLRFFQLSRTGQRDSAIDALRHAVSLERLYPLTDYNRFMEPLQGPDRFYAERVRRATSELAALDGLVEPDPDELLPDADDEPASPVQSEPEESAPPAEPIEPTPVPPDAAEPVPPPDLDAPSEPPAPDAELPPERPLPDVEPPVEPPAPEADLPAEEPALDAESPVTEPDA